MRKVYRSGKGRGHAQRIPGNNLSDELSQGQVPARSFSSGEHRAGIYSGEPAAPFFGQKQFDSHQSLARYTARQGKCCCKNLQGATNF